MAQDYLWKVTYERWSDRWNNYIYQSKVFKSKLNAMTFMNHLENSGDNTRIRLRKWSPEVY